MPLPILPLVGIRPTPIYPRVLDRLIIKDAEIQRLITSWLFISEGPGLDIKLPDGRYIQYRGIRFNGSPQHIFWFEFLPTLLDHTIREELKKTAELAKSTSVSVEQSVAEVVGLLNNLVQRAYIRAVDVDRSLMGDGFTKGESRDVAHNIEGYNRYIAEQSNVYVLEYSYDEDKVNPVIVQEDVLDIKPNFCGIVININALWRKIKGKFLL
ncbi:hypothetical protein [Maridesulfovibrio sp.]|uniref:hypothetical protein n=1 Tax=Maridesulfovibrio sp. TaxID=2795000 RepID=UPI002AA63F11|nr:hypothetical protein [Maridesulfovibrio sp.]